MDTVASGEEKWWGRGVELTRGLRADNRQHEAPSEQVEYADEYQFPIKELGTPVKAVELSWFHLMLLSKSTVLGLSPKDSRIGIVSKHLEHAEERLGLAARAVIASRKSLSFFETDLPEWTLRLYWFLLATAFESGSTEPSQESVLLELDWTTPLCQALNLTGSQFWEGLSLLSAVGAIQWQNLLGYIRRKAPKPGNPAQVQICVLKAPCATQVFKRNGVFERFMNKPQKVSEPLLFENWTTLQAHACQEEKLQADLGARPVPALGASGLTLLKQSGLRRWRGWAAPCPSKKTSLQPGMALDCGGSWVVYKQAEWAPADVVRTVERKGLDGLLRLERKTKVFHAGLAHWRVLQHLPRVAACPDLAACVPLQIVEVLSFGRKTVIDDKVVLVKEVSAKHVSLLAILAASAGSHGRTPRWGQATLSRVWPGGEQAVRTALRKLTGLGFLVPVKSSLQPRLNQQGVQIGYQCEAALYQLGSWNSRLVDLLVYVEPFMEGASPKRRIRARPTPVHLQRVHSRRVKTAWVFDKPVIAPVCPELWDSYTGEDINQALP